MAIIKSTMNRNNQDEIGVKRGPIMLRYKLFLKWYSLLPLKFVRGYCQGKVDILGLKTAAFYSLLKWSFFNLIIEC